jgi:DNA-binding response OmpR family regulator
MSKRVLVIDDDAHIREVLAVALADEGYKVLTASDGRVALDMVASRRPDVILLDVRMPGSDGAEFCRRYREQPGPHAPIIMLTAAYDYDADALPDDLQAAGMFSKPFRLDDVVRTIREQPHHSA